MSERSTSSSRGSAGDETTNNVVSTIETRNTRDSSVMIRTGSVTQAERDALGAEVGESIYNSDTGKVETWNGSEWAISAGELNLTNRLLTSRDISIYADGKQGKLDPNGLGGWNFQNEVAGEKINWYYVKNENTDNSMTLETLTSMYAVVKIYNEEEFFFNVYTKRQNDGNDEAFYRSKVTYELSTAFDGLAGETVLVYWGEEPTSFKNMKRVQLPKNPSASVGLQANDEDILFAAVSTNSGAAVGNYNFTIESLGIINDKRENSALTKIGRDFGIVDSELSALKLFKEAVELGRFFRGYVVDADGMNALPTPSTHEYVIRMDTQTIWEYTPEGWADTLIIGSLEGIAQEEELILSYSNNRYVFLDGMNDYVNITNVPANVMKYKEEWALSVKLEEAVSLVNNASYITLFKRGENEVTLRRGGTNWGIYVYNDTSAVCQANTWYAPTGNSTILIISTTTHLKYYLDGVLRANMAYNANTAGQDASGDLEVGNSHHRANWFGGVNNLMVIDGSASDLGTDQLSEFHSQENVSNMSFYPSVTDFIPLGERPYPTVLGLKQVLEGTVENSTESAIVVKDPAGGLGTPFPQTAGVYAKLDGTDNYIEFDNANADILDFSVGKQWACAFKCNGVSGVSDYKKTVLWSRGKNEITLVRGGTNWGLYVYCDGVAIGQANTWYAPQDDSTIVFTFDGTKLRYYISGALRSTLTVNGNISNNDPSGNLFLGKNYQGSYTKWYGGIEEVILSQGSNAVLSSSQINEFGNVAGSALSYYGSLQDYFNVGLQVFPIVNGSKSVVTGNLVNGNSEDFINL